MCHPGDLGHGLDKNQVEEIGEVNVLFIPVGGLFTVDARQATKVCEKVKPRLVIPMHHKTAKLAYPVVGVEDFLNGRKGLRRLGISEMEVRRDQLPSATEPVVLQHAL